MRKLDKKIKGKKSQYKEWENVNWGGGGRLGRKLEE
jgi:hypothetical protein